MCDARVLSHVGNSVISRCSECQCIFIWNNNLILTFSEKQFVQFKDFTTELGFNAHSFPFPDGQERVVMRTPVDDIQFTFTLEQWEDFQIAMQEALHMNEIYAMVDGN